MADDSYSIDQSAMDAFAASVSGAAGTMGTLQDHMGGISEYLTQVTSSASEFASFNETIVSSMEEMKSSLGDIVKLQEDELDVAKKITGEKAKGAKQAKKAAEQAKKAAKQQNVIRKYTAKATGFMKSSVTQVTGMSIGLGTIVGLLVKAYNNMRMVRAMSSQTASHFAGGQKSIGAARKSIMQLRRGFRASYEEAGKVVNTLAQIGMSAKEIASGPDFIAKKFKFTDKKGSKESALQAQRAYFDLMKYRDTLKTTELRSDAGAMAKEAMAHQKSYEKEFSDQYKAQKRWFDKSEAARRKSYKKTYGAAEELYAIEKQYGISVQTSGTFVKRMEQDFGKLNEEGRTMLGVAINTAAQLDNIGIGELIEDWQTLITQAQTYKTDVMGILSLYNTMMRKEGLMGIKNVPTRVKKDIVASVASMTATMPLGIKALLGRSSGGGAASRVMEFEGVSEEEKLKRALDELAKRKNVGPGASEEERNQAKIRVRELVPMFFKDAQADTIKYLADLVVDGKVNEKSTQEGLAEMAAEREQTKANEKLWRSERGTLITNAQKTSRGLQSIQDLIMKYAEDWMAKYVMPILGWLGDIYGALLDGFTSPEIIARREIQEDMQKMGGGYMIPPSLLNKIQHGEGVGRTGLEGASRDMRIMVNSVRRETGMKDQIVQDRISRLANWVSGGKYGRTKEQRDAALTKSENLYAFGDEFRSGARKLIHSGATKAELRAYATEISQRGRKPLARSASERNIASEDGAHGARANPTPDTNLPALEPSRS